MKSLVFMFSGQGSQYYNMGIALYKENKIFYDTMNQLDDYIISITGESVLNEIYNTNHTLSMPFTELKYSHPAIFMLEYSICKVFIENGIIPDYVFGASLGEFCASVVSGIITPEAALDAIIKQADVLENSCPTGGMIAVVDSPDIYYNSDIMQNNSELAAVNFNRHFVVSGIDSGLNNVKKYLSENNIIYSVLPVTQAFHSSIMNSAEDQYRRYLEKVIINKPNIPFISSVTGTILTELDSNYFWDVIRKPISFQKALLSLEKDNDMVYIDLGPAGTLANFVKYNLLSESGSEYFSIITQMGRAQENFKKMERFQKNYIS